MTRSYDERRYNLKTREWEVVATWSFTAYPKNNERLTVCRNGEAKTVCVEENWNFVYSLQKSKVLATGGAHGLFEFIDKELFADDLSTFAWKVLRHCFFDCKAAKQ